MSHLRSKSVEQISTDFNKISKIVEKISRTDLTLENNSITLEKSEVIRMQSKFQITLRAARVNAGLTIQEAAKRLKIGKDTLIKWEKDPGMVSPNKQSLISEAYDIPIDFIFFGKRVEKNSISA
jgi:DNA-binding transcriptional regulator YiaG